MPCQTSRPSDDVLTRRSREVLVLLLILIIGLSCAWLAFGFIDQAVVDADKPWVEHPMVQAALTVGMWLGNWQLAPVVVVVLLYAARKRWKRLLGTMVPAYLMSMGVVEALKFVVGRPRPRQIADATVFEGIGGGTSLPSGHAAFAFMMAMIVSAWFPRWRWPAWILAAFVAASRVLVDAHYVSDSIVGAVIGVVGGTIALWIWPSAGEEKGGAMEEPPGQSRGGAERLVTTEPDAGGGLSRRQAVRALIVVLFLAATLLAYGLIDPIPGFHENALFQLPWVQMLGQVGRDLGTWDLAPLLVAIALIAGRNCWKRLLGNIVAGFAIQTALTEGIKWLAGRPRPSDISDPDLFFGPGTEHHSFPSGHASFIFVFATICSAWFPRARLAVWALAVFVAASRVVLSAHYVSDTVFGALLGIISGWIVLAIWSPWCRDEEEESAEEAGHRDGADAG